MVMASYQAGSGLPPNKITKSRNKTVVKPILKKLSQSEKNSLDLDHGWEEQIHYSNHGWGGSSGGGSTGAGTAQGFGRDSGGASSGVYDFGGGGRLARDVSFSLSATDLHGSGGSSSRSVFTHARSASGTSHVSVATTGSGHASGSRTFVHPFQQTPRTSTPPLSLSYANSLASFDAGNPRDYSPTITEDDDVDDLDAQNYHRGNYHAQTQAYSSGLRRPSLASQRTSSLSDINAPPPLRVNTTRGTSVPSSSRLGHGILTSSRSDLQLNILSTSLDSPTSTAAAASGAALASPPPVASPSSSAQPMSPLRTSLEMGFRLRSRSEVDSAARQEEIRRERRRFDEKQKMKEEKYAREDMRRREKAATKEAEAQLKREKGAMAKTNSSSRRNSSAEGRPSASRNNTPTGGVSVGVSYDEKVGFASRHYDSTQAGQTPRADEVVSQVPQRRSNTAKQKTQSAWTSFILWLKIKILRLGKS